MGTHNDNELNLTYTNRTTSLLSPLLLSEKHIKSEVVKAVVRKISVLYDMTPCILVRSNKSSTVITHMVFYVCESLAFGGGGRENCIIINFIVCTLH
jgi:hypothetical protein